MFKHSLTLMAFLLVIAISAQAGILKFEKGIGWASLRDLTSSEYGKKFDQYRKDGFIIIDVDAYSTPKGIRYAMVWRKNTDKRKWAQYRDMTSDRYHERWKEFKEKGYRPHDIESYQVNGKQRYAGIWVQNKEGYAWSSRRDMTAAQYGDYFKSQSEKGYRVVDIEAYQTSKGLRYAAIWVQNKEKIKWAQLRDMTRKKYQSEIDTRSKQGFRVVDYETYVKNEKRLYAAIWEKRSGYAWQTRTNRSEKEFANLWREYRDKGYRLVDFECDQSSKGMRYSGVWIENASRYRYSKKGQLDQLISQYHDANNLPGISVAIIKDGEMVYRRGFGQADISENKVAHGETVYLAASVSKVIGGTIAVKLADKGRLESGQVVDLDLNSPTRDYLINVRRSNGTVVTMPSRHTHTVAQLFSHLGCVAHYDGPQPSTQQYNLAIDALPQIWNADFVDPCTIGSSWNYSTHAFTYLAAVLETVSQRRSSELIRSEIARPYGLSSMRSMFTNNTVPSNYDRAQTYNNNNTEATLDNNSWKVFGGGIEATTVDLARFGWKVLNGEIVNATARDNILWQRVNPNRLNGIAWEIRTIDGRRVAEHGGSWTGAFTRLRVYRDDGLVVAIMSNRRGHTTSGNLRTLADNIADLIL